MAETRAKYVVFCRAAADLHYLRDKSDALAARLQRTNTPDASVLLVCAGSGDRFSLEDALAAGGLISRLTAGLGDDGSGAHGGDPGHAARVLYDHHRDDLPAILRATDNGRRLLKVGLEKDVSWCARVSVFNTLAMMIDGAIEGARAS